MKENKIKNSVLKDLLLNRNISVSDKLIAKPIAWNTWGSPEVNWKPWDGSDTIKRKEDQKKDI